MRKHLSDAAQWIAESRSRPLRAVFILGALIAALLPLITQLPNEPGRNYISVVQLCVIFAVVALGLNVVTGLTGLLDIGIVVFASIGAYTAAILYDRQWMQFPFSFVVVLIAGGLHAAVWGLIRGAPTLRLSGDYYAIVTLAFAEIIRIVQRNEGWLTGAGQGLKGYPAVNLWGAKLTDGEYDGLLRSDGVWSYDKVLGYDGLWFGNTIEFYYLCLVILALTILAVWRLERSRTGRAWLAIKADETSAMSSGVNLARYKMTAFAISAFIAGVGGALFGFRNNVISTSFFDTWFSVIVLCCVVLGGMGSIGGVLGGTIIVTGLGEALRWAVKTKALKALEISDKSRLLLFGAMLVIVMLFRPQGLIGRARAKPTEIPPDSGDKPLYQIGGET